MWKMAEKVRVETESADDDGFTDRALVSVIVDVMQLAQSVERVKITVFAIARERGIETPAEKATGTSRVTRGLACFAPIALIMPSAIDLPRWLDLVHLVLG